MLNNSTKMMFLLILMMSTLISISSNSWLNAWMGLEINLLSFIPLMNDDKMMSTESSLKYFLVQALASSILLFSVILFLLNSNKSYNLFMEMIIFSSLILKMGSAPFHFWFPNMMEGLSWFNALILMTWQKIAPLMLITYIIYKPLIIITIFSSVMIGALGGLNQTSLRKLMSYSSINHLGWMQSSMYDSNTVLIIYFMFYCFLNFSLIFMFNMFKISHINQLFSLFFLSKNMKMFIMLNLLSLGGLPPFLGFFPKWMTIQYLTMNNQFILLTFMMMMTLITLYFYLRLCYSALMFNYYENNWMNFSKYNMFYMKIVMSCSFLSTFGLFMISSMYFII